MNKAVNEWGVGLGRQVWKVKPALINIVLLL